MSIDQTKRPIILTSTPLYYHENLIHFDCHEEQLNWIDIIDYQTTSNCFSKIKCDASLP